MSKLKTAALVASAIAMIASTPHSANAAQTTPRWVLHVQNFSGGISNGVRFSLDPAVTAAQARHLAPVPDTTAPVTGNVRMNSDSNPKLPQNEESIAYSLDDPMVAVAAANDYINGGNIVMRTHDGGRHWATTFVVPQLVATREFCSGGDPAVTYSRRDHAFYMAQLCFFRTGPASEVQVYKSLTNGATWTPSRFAAVAASNVDNATGTVDDTVFNDKELIAVDNTPTSRHYGRLYVSYTKFHLAADGSSDTCPIQLSYTDNVPTQNPSQTAWSHTAVLPDDTASGGVGESANQFSTPVVEKDGSLDIAYSLEECNTSLDHGLRFQKSTDGGASFLNHGVHVNKPGQWRDNPDLADLIPTSAIRVPNTVSLAYSQRTGTLVFAYTNYITGRGHGDIAVSLSHDGGTSWSDSQVISLDANAPAANNQFFPWVAATPHGRFVAMWLDRRDDPRNHKIGTYEARSTDDGVTWVNRKISTAMWDPNLGFFTSGAFAGDYSGLAANDRVIYPAWTDGRNTQIVHTGIGDTDVFTDVEIAPVW